jgi:ABC-type sugar transport system substrate-binding protein
MSSPRLQRISSLGISLMLVAACSSSGTPTAVPASQPPSEAPPTAAPASQEASAAASPESSASTNPSYITPPVITNNYPDRPTEGPMIDDSLVAAKPYTIAFSHPAFDSGFFVAVEYGAETECTRLKINCIFTFGGGYDHPEKQVSDVEDLLAQQPDALIVNPADVAAMQPIIDGAVAQGKIVTSLIPNTSTKYYGFAGPSHFDGGVVTTRLLIEALGGKGNIIALDGPKGLGFSDEPEEARNEILPNESTIKVVAEQNTDTSRTQTTQVFEDLLRAHPDTQGVWETFIDPAIAVAQVLKNQGMQPGDIKVVGKAWVPEAKTWIEQGWIYGTSLQQDVLTGQQAIRQSVSLLNGDKPPFHVSIPYASITKDNVSTFDFSSAEAPKDFKPAGKITAP